MSKTEQIKRMQIEGKTAQETFNAIQGVSMSYIYKVRSEHRKVNPGAFKTVTQQEIIRLHNRSLSSSDIATQIGCSKQYVYKVLTGKSKKDMLPFIRSYQVQDEYLTPLYAIIPIAKYLKPCSTIWCPFDLEHSQYVRYFKQQGHKVVATHINNGQDFFQTEPPENCDYIISNPPYSLKTEVFQRLNELNIPYAMLVSNVGLFSAKSRFEVFKDGIEQMVFPARIAYMKNYGDDRSTANPPFDSCYICKRVLPEKFIFEEIDKKIITL